MLGGANYDRMRQTFADQFEAQKDGFLYRKYNKQAPIRISVAERDAFIEGYNRYLRYSFWLMIGGIAALAVVACVYIWKSGNEPTPLATWVGIGAILVLSVASQFWAFDAPMRALRGRGNDGEARSPEETKRIGFAKLTYGQLAATAGFAAVLLLKLDRHSDLFSGWNLAWIIMAVGLVVLAAVQAFRKWRFESARR